jgi:hypothetical protein
VFTKPSTWLVLVLVNVNGHRLEWWVWGLQLSELYRSNEDAQWLPSPTPIKEKRVRCCRAQTRVHWNHLEDMLKHKFLGPTPGTLSQLSEDSACVCLVPGEEVP